MKAQNIIHSFTLVFMLCAFMNAPATAQSYNYFNGGAFYGLDWNSNMNPPQWELMSTYPGSIIKTLDSNLFIHGIGPWGGTLPKTPISFIKTDALSNSIWSTRIYDLSGGSTHFYNGGNAVQTSDSGYVAVVNLQFTDFNMPGDLPWIFKLDKNGQYQWAKYYSRDNTYSGTWAIQTPVRAIISNYSGGFLLVVNYSPTISSGYPCLINCDKDGNILWKKYYTGIPFFPTKIVKTPDDGYMICGAHNSYNPALMKIDSSGNVQFYKRYTGNYFQWDFSMSEWNNGQYFITGSSKMYNAFNSYSPFILSTDVLGNLSWFKEYNGNGTDDSTVFASEISVLKNGDLLVCGARTRNNVRELSLFKTDNSGGLIWSRSKKGPWATYEGNILLRFDDDVMMTWDGNYTNWTFAHLSPAGDGICNYATRSWHEDPVAITSIASVPGIAADSTIIINILPPPINFQFIYGVPDSAVCTANWLGIEEQNGENGISIYPNPTSGVFTITTEKLAMKNIEVINVLGEKVYRLNAHTLLNHTSTIDLSSQSDGIYFLRVQTEQGVVSKKVMVLR